MNPIRGCFGHNTRVLADVALRAQSRKRVRVERHGHNIRSHHSLWERPSDSGVVLLRRNLETTSSCQIWVIFPASACSAADVTKTRALYQRQGRACITCLMHESFGGTCPRQQRQRLGPQRHGDSDRPLGLWPPLSQVSIRLLPVSGLWPPCVPLGSTRGLKRTCSLSVRLLQSNSDSYDPRTRMAPLGRPFSTWYCLMNLR